MHVAKLIGFSEWKRDGLNYRPLIAAMIYSSFLLPILLVGLAENCNLPTLSSVRSVGLKTIRGIIGNAVVDGNIEEIEEARPPVLFSGDSANEGDACQ